MLKEAYQKILYGTESEAKKAWQGMRKLVYSGGNGKYDEIKKELEKVKENYKNIVEDWRREFYISSISIMYFLHHKESNPNFFLPFLLGLLENENGKIRYCAYKMISNDLGPLTVHLRHPGSTSDKISVEKAEEVLFAIHSALEYLIQKHYDKKYKKYKYVQKLPPCVYKTLEMLLCELYEDCGKEFFESRILKF